MPQVIALGDINLDIIAHIARYPQPGGDGLASRACLRPGGSAANTALILARYGIETAIIGRVGTDALGTQLLSDLQAGGVDVSLVQHDSDANTGTMFIGITPDGERTMFGFRGANARTDPAGIPVTGWHDARHFHLSGYALLESPQREAALYALELAQNAGLSTSLDAGLEILIRQGDLVRALLPQVDLFFPNLDEVELLAGTRDPDAAAVRLREQGVKVVALKLGGQGCLVATADGVFTVPPFEVEVCDTTGAGDAFDAGVICGHLHGLSWRAAALLGNALGALVAASENDREEAIVSANVVSFLRQQRDRPQWSGWQCEFDAVINSVAM
ncbi:MAG: carbohydrate kinase family protein [Anaerolineae bacterium]|nr:carbohydrate kinase family protein [Anaerolineae bacterium]MDH7472976.1 carbohydrate kinase family protein [Anaerolineae bacterium]